MHKKRPYSEREGGNDRDASGNSDGIDDETFINNSDYPISHTPLYLLSNSKETEDKDENDGNESEEPDVFTEANSVVDVSGNEKSEPKADDKNSLQTTYTLKAPPELPKPESNFQIETGKKEAGDDGLSYSQQQKLIQVQSPNKRRDPVPAADPNEPRLVIDRLILTNFKSYAGEQIIGPFHSSFSAIVGPNGSGKSNVIDSLLFVFGFRALKMRQGKLSELIHNSEGGEKLDYCQVDIHFKHVYDVVETRELKEIPGSEIVISRKAFKNNQSQYMLNGKVRSYGEVTLYLREKGIDLDHKRFLILQGEVESIAQMKAKAERENEDGLLEYLEDIIGTAKYKSLIEENLTKVDELNEVCSEKENRLDLVIRDKDELEERKNEALKFLEKEKELISKQSIQFQANILRNKRIADEYMGKLNDLKDKLEKEKEANKEISKEMASFTKSHNEISSLISKLKAEAASHTKTQKKISKDIVTLEEKLRVLTGKFKKIEKTVEQLKHALSSSEAKLQNNNLEATKLKEELDVLMTNLETEKKKQDELRKSLTDKTSEFTKKIEELQRKLEPWNDKLKEKENAITLIDSSIEMLRSQKDGLSKILEEAKTRLLDIKTEGKKKELELEETEGKLESIRKQCEIGEEQCNQDKAQLNVKKKHLMNLRQKTQEAMHSLSDHQNRNKVLTGLVKLANSGRIEGFHGRLGDLGVIDDKYDVAISTACSALDSMVVDKVETAQICIEYLRKNKLGYANFICLDKLRKFNLDKIQTPGNPSTVKRLFDLIYPNDPKFAPAFYSKLFNTLVASNLNEAKSVAYGAKRWRVVTLDGKLVDTSGTMSGGGNYVSKGMMQLSSRATSQTSVNPLEAEKMRSELQRTEQEYELFSTEVFEKEKKLQTLKEMIPECELSISRLNLDIDSLAKEKKEVLANCKRLIQEAQENQEQKGLEKQIEMKNDEKKELVKEKDELKSNMNHLELLIKELEEKIMDAGGVELRIQNSKVDSIRQKIEIINEKLSQNKLLERRLENEIKRHSKVVDESAEELKSTEKGISEIKEEQSLRNDDLKEIEGVLEKVNLEIESRNEELDQLNINMEELTTKINKFRSAEIEIENKIEQHSAILKKAEHEIRNDEDSLKELIIRDVSSYIDWMDEDDQKRYNSGTIDSMEEEEINDIDMNKVEEEIAELEQYMNTVKVDIEVLKEYASKKAEFDSRRVDLNTAVEKRDDVRNLCDELKRKRLDEFMEGFNTISMSLKEMYQMITMGGNAELELVDSLDPFAEGILFSVMPPKKSWKNISNLSGGEKTLSSLALVFALHKYKPTPLYVMDEIDAALDFRNVSIVANYIKERTKNAQFVVISLRNNMFELASQLIGIYKVNHMTKSVSLRNIDFLEEAKQ